MLDYNFKSRPENRCTNKNDNLNSEEMYEWQTIRENKLQFLVSWQLDYTPYTASHCKPFKIRSLCTTLIYLTTFRTFGCIHSRSRRITARQNSRIRKASDMQPYISNRTHKKCCFETPGSYTNITTVCQKKLTQSTQQGSKRHNKFSNKTSSFFVIKTTRCTNFTNLFCHETLHVSDSSSVRNM